MRFSGFRFRDRRDAIEVVVGKLVNVEVVLGLLASIHHEPGGMRRRVLI